MKALYSFAALAVTALALQGLPAKAQDSVSGSTSTSSSGSTSASSSRSGASTTSGTSANQQRQNTRQNATTNNSTSVPITFNDPAGAAGTNGAGGGGSSTPGGSTGAPFYGQSDITVRTTPTVYAPPVSGGNPCTLAVSGGVSVIGWGAAAGGTFVDQDCADRQKIAMIHNAGYAKAAQELMCNDKATYLAFRGTQTPCNPRPQFDGTPAAGPVAPQPLGPPPPVTRTTSAFQPAGRFACMDARGREVPSGTPGASCGYI
jgi:hypothetical protein